MPGPLLSLFLIPAMGSRCINAAAAMSVNWAWVSDAHKHSSCSLGQYLMPANLDIGTEQTLAAFAYDFLTGDVSSEYRRSHRHDRSEYE